MLNFKQKLCSPIFKIFILLFYFSFISSAFSQTDSLATKTYKELTGLYVQNINKNPGIAIIYMQKAHELAVAKNDNYAVAKTFYGLAFCDFYLTNNSKALENLEKAIVMFSKDEVKYNEILSQSYNLKGMVLTDMREDSEALNSYIKAKDYTKSIQNKIKISTNIAFIKKAHKDYMDAIAVFKENLDIIEKSSIDDETKLKYEVSILANIAETYLLITDESKSEDYTKEARYYNNLGLQKCSKEENRLYYLFLLVNEMTILFKNDHYNESIKLAQKIITNALENEDENSICMAYFYMGRNYANLKKYEEAITFLEKANTITQKSERKYPIEKQLNKNLAICYTTIGEIEIGQLYFEKYITLLEAESAEDIKVLKEVYIKNDIAELRDELDHLKLSILAEKNKKQQLFFISGSLIILLISSVTWYRKKVKKVKRRVAEVLQKVDELEKTQAQDKNTVSTISEKVTDEKAAFILEKLKIFEEDEEFLSPDCSLSYVAEKLDSNTSYVSNVINNYKNKTFKSYITELRINTALIRLKNDDKLRSYTIQAIAEDFGFKRQETFSKAFKSQTGIYPSHYIKKISENAKNH